MSRLVSRDMMLGTAMSSKAREKKSKTVPLSAMIHPPLSSKKSYINGKLVKVDPEDREFLNAEIYIPTDKGYQKKVSAYVTVVNDAVTSRIDKKYKFIPCPDAKIYPSDDEYQYYLDVYYNNQQFYIQYKDSVPPEDFRGATRELETWFVQINEPCHSLDDVKSWNNREKVRQTGISYYCDPLIKEVLQ
jgi:hypothetical protein